MCSKKFLQAEGPSSKPGSQKTHLLLCATKFAYLFLRTGFCGKKRGLGVEILGIYLVSEGDVGLC